MGDTGGRLRPQPAIPSPVMVTRGERIRRERRLKRLSIKALAAEIGISERTLRGIELDERPDARSTDVVEAYLGLTDETPARTQSPALADATHAELAYEVYKRLMRLADADPVIGAVPEEAVADVDRILGPPANETRRPRESDG